MGGFFPCELFIPVDTIIEGCLPVNQTIIREMIFRVLLSVSLCFFSQALVAFASTGDLHSHVMRYRDTELSQDALEKIKKYDHLIDYFTGFYYFSPHQKVSPDFVKALILAESGADPDAVSSKEALGLGQILLSTGREAGHVLARSRVTFRYVSRDELKHLDRDDLFEPAINILLTCYLVAKYNYKYDGRLDLVISAWNAGENTDSLARMQHAPYEETRNLIGKVNGYYLFLLKEKGALR